MSLKVTGHYLLVYVFNGNIIIKSAKLRFTKIISKKFVAFIAPLVSLIVKDRL